MCSSDLAINEIFAESDRDKSLKIIDDLDRMWTSMIGTKGNTGKKTINPSTFIAKNFEVEESAVKDVKSKVKHKIVLSSDLFDEEDETIEHDDDFSDDEISKLEELEQNIV